MAVWKKNEPSPPSRVESAVAPKPQPSSTKAAPDKPSLTATKGSATQATIGPSISIKGDVSGEEDLLVEGRVEGAISLARQSVTVGSGGWVKADIHGRKICVEGEVYGNLHGEEEVVIRKTGKVEGNATAPRVSLENGANFRGSIDMHPDASAAGLKAGRSAAKPSRDRAAAPA